jgi:hypothetical protein
MNFQKYMIQNLLTDIERELKNRIRTLIKLND